MASDDSTERIAERRSRNMRAVRSRDTLPEKYVRRRLFADGFRFRLHDPHLPGHPDITLRRYKIAVFINGCFWHGHDCPRGRGPKTNVEFWSVKIRKNCERDQRNISELQEFGWTPIIIWTCEVSTGCETLLETLREQREHLP